jgi:hypothetical protein
MVSSGLRDTVDYTIAQLGLSYNLHWEPHNDGHQSLKTWNLSSMQVASPKFIRLSRAPAKIISSLTRIPSHQLPALGSSFVDWKVLI